MNTSVFMDTLGNLRKAWQGIGGSSRDAQKPPVVKAQLPDDDLERVRQLMRVCLEARGGEVSGRRRAAHLGHMYLTLNAEGRRRFLELLARDFAVDREELARCAGQVQQAEGLEDYLTAEVRLREVLISPRLRLLKQFNDLPQGAKFLIDLRAELLNYAHEEPMLKSLDTELKRLLETWFDVGFLELRHITWDSPAALLEKLIAYEAVHQIHSWKDLRNRLESDRRCYAFFHPGMPEEPLIFVEVALVNGIAGNIQTLLDEASPEIDPSEADTAIFYSISNTQKGLRGISFGHFLIKQVADDLNHEFPNITTFSTLSPIPGFRRWLTRTLTGAEAPEFEEGPRRSVIAAAELLGTAPRLEEILARLNWHRDEEVCERLRDDPVERFHLGNGARIERLNWLGDTSPKGMDESCGLMVNYLYKLDEVEKNHEAYAAEKRIVSSRKVSNLLQATTREPGRKGRMQKIFVAKPESVSSDR